MSERLSDDDAAAHVMHLRPQDLRAAWETLRDDYLRARAREAELEVERDAARVREGHWRFLAEAAESRVQRLEAHVDRLRNLK